jgi:hypothetical protein
MNKNIKQKLSLAERFLAGGLICTVITAVLVPIIGSWGLEHVLVPFALILLIIAGIVARADNLSLRRKSIGMILYLIGVVLYLIDLICFFVYVGYIIEMFEKSGMNMFNREIARSVLTYAGCLSVVKAVLMVYGLWLRTGWSACRCAWWGIAILFVPMVAAVMFWKMFLILN